MRETAQENKAKIMMLTPDSEEFRFEVSRQEIEKSDQNYLKESAIMLALRSVSQEIGNKIDREDFSIGLIKGAVINSKQTYQIDMKDPQTYFISRQIEENIKTSFSPRLPNRRALVEQALLSLDDSTDKLIVRTDLRGFFESVPHDKLINLLNGSHTLSRTTCRFISSILEEYRTISGRDRGIPRGLGISAMLAEIYIQQLDIQIRKFEGLRIYVRYVDDIMIIFDSETHHETKSARQKLIRKTISQFDLSMNPAKTCYIESREIPAGKNRKLTFLGYEFTITKSENNKKTKQKIDIDISKRRVERYQRRIMLAFEAYDSGNIFNSPVSSLYDRIKFLTSNTRLSNNKRNALIGIYYSNSLLNTASPRIIELDKFYNKQLAARTTPPGWRKRLESLSFREGFEERIFHQYSDKRLPKIVKVWKYEE